MVSPMREKRTWPPQDKDSDGETVAAFEAAVAVVKETVVRSGEVLVSAKEDLNDHQRWLKAQTAKVAADRQRHDRFLQRQRDRQEALERREQKRARHQARRQAVAGSIKDAIAAAIYTVRAAVWLVVAKIVGGLSYIDALAAYGLSWTWAQIRYVALYGADAIWRGVSFAGTTARSLAVSLWSLLSAAGAAIGAKVNAVSPRIGNFLSLYFGGVAARTRDASRAAGKGLGAGLSGISAQAETLTRQAGEALGPAMAAIGARAHALAPSLTDRIGRAGQAAGQFAKGGAARVQSLLARAAPPAAESENALSSPRTAGRFDLSQMLIIAGALLLVCGGLMLGGGLVLRAKTPTSTPLAAASESEPIAWLFEHPSLPLDERSVFVFDATPDGPRIKGFAIGGVNLSEERLGALGGVIKPDGHDQDLDLALSVEKPEGDADEATSAQPMAGLAEGAIPPEAPFRLIYLFPSEGADGGLTSQQVLSSYGGVLLKVRYEMEGKQRSFIQYLPASLLEEQLAEILASAKGS
jgi:hypothetical protein